MVADLITEPVAAATYNLVNEYMEDFKRIKFSENSKLCKEAFADFASRVFDVRYEALSQYNTYMKTFESNVAVIQHVMALNQVIVSKGLDKSLKKVSEQQDEK